MCGIAIIVGTGPGGPGQDRDLFRQMLALLAPRGEVEETLEDSGLLAGTQRLRIVDRDRAVQPWLSADRRWLLCYNGEIFNYRQLRAELTGLGRRGARATPRSPSRRSCSGAIGPSGGCAASSRSPSPTGRPAGPISPVTRSGSSRCTGRSATAG